MTTPVSNPPVRASRFEVSRRISGTAKMSDGSTRPNLFIQIRDKETKQVRTRWIGMVANIMCLPEGAVQGDMATDDQIIRAVLGDEHIFSGAPTYEDVS